MNKIILVIAFCLVFFIGAFFLFSHEIVLIANNNFLTKSQDFTFLLLGKPGPGYIGSENTDSIIVVYYQSKNNTLYLIPIPRDLVVYNEKGELEKINALYGGKKIKLLLKKASDYTGLKINYYLVIDLELVKKLVDQLGGLEIVLDEPVTDALTLYTLPAGKQKLNGDLIELVLRSRYNPEGDFARIKNQIKVIYALKEKFTYFDTQKKIELIRFLDQHKYHWQTNLTRQDLFRMAFIIQDLNQLKIIPLVFDTHSGLLTSSYFNLYNTPNVYGLLPRSGIDNYEAIRIYLRAQIQE